jgi:hypothetical protein
MAKIIELTRLLRKAQKVIHDCLYQQYPISNHSSSSMTCPCFKQKRLRPDLLGVLIIMFDESSGLQAEEVYLGGI